jgi:hypothetical protein
MKVLVTPPGVCGQGEGCSMYCKAQHRIRARCSGKLRAVRVCWSDGRGVQAVQL